MNRLLVRLLLVLCAVVGFAPTALAVDCNRNAVEDREDIATSLSADCDQDQVPDECELPPFRLGIFGPGSPVVDRPRAAVAADLTGDGRADLVLAAVEPGGVSRLLVLATTPDRGFFPVVTYEAGEDLSALVAADLDADGFVDIAATNGAGLLVFKNRGDGTLGEPVALPTSGAAELLAVADVTGDRRPDLVVATSPERRVEVFQASNEGGFSALEAVPFDERPEAMTIADMDGDGDLDVAILSRSAGSVSLLFNDGAGTMAVPVAVEVPGRSPFEIVADDFNADGHIDLALANLRGLAILLGDGNASFPVQTELQLPPSTLSLADIDSDGRSDLVVGSSNSSLVIVLISSGDGTFGPSAVNSSTTVTWRPGTVTPGDFDGDGDIDVAVTDKASDGLNVVWNGDPDVATVGLTKSAPNIPVGFKPHGAVQGDFDGDGTPDVATSNGHDRGVSFLFGTGTGTFEAPTVENGRTYLFPGAGHLNHLTAGDFDGDGDLDAAAVDREQNRVGILKNRGDGTFDQEIHYPADSGAYYVQAADLDGDGDLDLGIANASANTASLLYNDGDGSFAQSETLRVETQPESLALADLDADGVVDVVVANRVSASIWFFRREVDGTYTSRPPLFTLGESISVVIEDLDADGDPDLVSLDPTEAEIFLNKGDGSLERGGLFPLDVPLGQPPFLAALADVNADGSPDLLSANFQAGSVSVLISKGNGTFHVPFKLPAGDIVRSVVSGDFDHDGDLDLVATNRLDDHITVYLNELQRPNAPNELPPEDCGGLLFRRGDGNGDGAADLTDASFLLAYLFARGPHSPCAKSPDVDDTGHLNILDVIYLVEYLFRAGAAPAEPFASCGEDPTADDLSCNTIAACP